MKHALEMGPVSMVYIPSFIKIGSDILLTNFTELSPS
jgi:hypothetical protein